MDQTHILSVEGITAVAWEITRLFKFMVGGPEEAQTFWADLSDSMRIDLSLLAEDILEDPAKGPEERHEVRLHLLETNGWKWGYFYNPIEKTDPLVTDWDACPPAYQQAETIFWSTVIALGIQLGIIDQAVLDAANVERAKKAEEFNKQLVYEEPSEDSHE